MFVVSLKGSLFKRCVFIFSIIGLVGCFAVIFYNCNKGMDNSGFAVSVNDAGTEATKLIDFISSYGWEVKPEPDDVREVLIPAEFDDVYENYNEIQLAQGLDLIPFSGKRVKKWTYTVTNYPGYETTDYIKINVLIYNSCVIAGDVCSVELDGFMHGFEKE